MIPHVYILCLTICAGTLSAQSLISMTTRAGSSVVLPCECRDALSQSPHIEWRTISETVFERMGEEQYQGEGYEDRVDVPQVELLKGNCSLVLKNVRPADDGVYESYLLVKRMKRSLDSEWVFLQKVELSVVENAAGDSLAPRLSPDHAGSAGVTSVPSKFLMITILTNLLLYHI